MNAGGNVDIGAYEASSSYLVTTTVDAVGYGSIVSAVAWANVSFNENPANLANPAPNTVTFDTASSGLFSTARTINLSGPLVFSGTSTPEAINGSGVGTLDISGGGGSQIIKVSAGSNVTLTGMTLSGGQAASGGAVDNKGTLDISGVAFKNDAATSSGGGILNESQGNLTVANSTLSGDSAAQGGAIYNSGTATIENTTLSLDTSSSGGALENSGSLTVDGSHALQQFIDRFRGSDRKRPGRRAGCSITAFSNDTAGGWRPQGGAISSMGVL